jgi:magnesium transporter
VAGDIVEHLDEDRRAEVFRLLGLEDKAAVLREVEDSSAREELIEGIPDAELADILEQARSDDAADLFEELDEERQGRVLDAVEAETRAEIELLRAYPEESAGGLMQTELLRLRGGTTVEQAVQVVRREYDPRMGDVFDLYVIDDEGRVLGRMRNRLLLTSDPGTVIDTIMITDVLTVPVSMDQEEIASVVQDYDVASVAVVDEHERLVGRILVDDILDVLEEEATEDAAKMAGTSPDDVHSRSVARTVRARLPWLLATFAAGLGSITLILSWQEALTRTLPMAVAVIPIIAGMSGNVGTQASSVTVRGIAVGEIDYQRLRSVIWKELISGSVFALLFGVALYAFVVWVMPHMALGDHAWPVGFSRFRVALVPAIAIGTTILTGATTGTLVPLALHRFGRDPPVASSPFISTMNDLVGISILTAVVHIFLS